MVIGASGGRPDAPMGVVVLFVSMPICLGAYGASTARPV